MPKTKTTAIPVERTQLANGLRVVMSPDRAASGVFVATYYDVGFRSEPEGRTGFAHLFEHLMFQGSVSLEKGQHIELVNANGGVLNGSTRNDFTNYFELMPSNALELALFLEADRMRGLRLTPENMQNQVDVVKEEIRVNVYNQPFGGFPWLWLPMAMFDTFPNAHDAYGDFDDLDAATLDDVAAFFDRYYAPGNCVLTVVGDINVEQTAELITRQFGDIAARDVPATVDAREPIPTAERRTVRNDPRAPQPAFALGYRTPDPIQEFDDYVALVLAQAVLTNGDASRLYQRLIKKDRSVSHLGGEIGLVAGTFEVRGPSMMRLVAFYPGAPDPDPIVAAIDEEVERLTDHLDGEELDRFRNAYLAEFLGEADSLIQRGMLIAALEQQRSRAEMVNEIAAAIGRVSPEDVRRVTAAWLRPERRTVLDLRPGSAA